MKNIRRIVPIVAVLFYSIGYIYGQENKTYLLLGVGTGYLMDGNLATTPIAMLELGKSYRWIDVVASIESENEYNGNTSMSINVKTKFDIIRMIKSDLRHSFRLGIGKGIGTTIYYKWWNSIPTNDIEGKKSFLYTHTMLTANYEYNLVDKLWVGAFFQDYISRDFFGKYYIGISLRTDI